MCCGPTGAARVGYIDGKYVVNPMVDEMPETSLDLVVAGTGNGNEVVPARVPHPGQRVVFTEDGDARRTTPDLRAERR